MTVSPVDVFVWYEDTTLLDPHALRAAEDVLCDEERTRRDRLHFPEDQRDFAMAHGLLRHSLSKQFPDRRPEDWQFEKDAFGKPSIRRGTGPEPTLEFNLSHTRGFVACVLSSARVGIDVERIRSGIDYEDIAESCYSTEELAVTKVLPVSDRAGRILELWTLKEAFLKAKGVGLSGGLDSVRVELVLPTGLRFHAPAEVEAKAWKFLTAVPHPEVRLAIAIESRNLPRILMQGRELGEFQGVTLFGECHEG
jgi:4'-phosphopantetheinyl transferase